MDQPTTTLTAADHGATISLKAGDRALLRLRDRPGGFRWEEDGPASALVDVRRVPRASGRGRPLDGEAGTAPVGGATDWEWTLTARKAGSARVAFKLWRGFEGESSVAQRFEVTIEIRR
jgi:predicted secreted protein